MIKNTDRVPVTDLEKLSAEVTAANDAVLLANVTRTGRIAAKRRLRLAQAALLFAQSRWTCTEWGGIWQVHRANQHPLVSAIMCSTKSAAEKTAHALNDVESCANPLKKLK